MSQRIDALNRERALARRVSEFAKEQELFDEDDTRVSASRTEYGAEATAAAPANNPSANSAQLAGGNKDGSAMGPAGGANPGTGTTPTQSGGGGGNGSLTNNAPTMSVGGVASQADAPAAVESSQGSRQTYTGVRPEELRVGDDSTSDDDSLEGLRAQKEALEKEAKKLHEAASALEHNAAGL
jgi:hypothetical protein